MNVKSKVTVIGLLAALLFTFSHLPSFAGDNVEELKKQIGELQKRVEELEASKPQEDKGEDSWGTFNRPQGGQWDPFAEIGRMQEEMNRMFQDSFSGRGLSNGGMFSNAMSFDSDIDVKETADGYEIRLDMAGLDKDKVDIQINEHSITLKGERSSENTEEGADRFFSAKSFGSFIRTIPLPVDADTARVKTEQEGDSLVIRMPKKTS